MSLEDKKQAFLKKLEDSHLLPQDFIHVDLFKQYLDEFVAGVDEPVPSVEDQPAPPLEASLEAPEVAAPAEEPAPEAPNVDA